MFCELILNHFIFQSVEFTKTCQTLEVSDILVDQLARSLSALVEDNAPYHDALWGGEMSSQ